MRAYSSNPTSSVSSATSDEANKTFSSGRPNGTAQVQTAATAPATKSNRELPSQTDSRRSQASQTFSQFMDNLQSRTLFASQTLNDLTGYSAIESIKATNACLESDLARAQAELGKARQDYKAVNAQRASTQREVTALLARKDTWTPLDLERFTTMYRQDHELEAAVGAASGRLTEAEAEEARLSQALNSGILKRYHEEQIWSDRIRRQSTWGTWGLMGVNVVLFLVLQFVAEPWKRSRLMKGIAAEEKAALEAVRKELEEVRGALTGRVGEDAAAAASAASAASVTQAALDVDEHVDAEAASLASTWSAKEGVLEAATAGRLSWKDSLSDPSQWRPVLQDLYSERSIDLRMRDLSVIVLESAATGAAVVAAMTLLWMRHH